MRLRAGAVLVVIAALLARPGLAEVSAAVPETAPLAAGQLPSVVELPVYFRLYRIYLPAARHASYRGSSAMLYGLSGRAEMQLEGGDAQPLAEGAGAYIAAGQGVTVSAAEAAPSELLLFVLTARPNQKPPFDRPAVAKEVFRTGDPLPGLQHGAYDFTLSRLTFPPGMPAGRPHYRTGAALNYVLAGTGILIADGKDAPMPVGSAHVALAGWFHQWANPGDTPLVLLQANISQEGAAPLVPEPAK
jgi:quercetin dioxygenase-like cupin family protein